MEKSIFAFCREMPTATTVLGNYMHADRRGWPRSRAGMEKIRHARGLKRFLFYFNVRCGGVGNMRQRSEV